MPARARRKRGAWFATPHRRTAAGVRCQAAITELGNGSLLMSFRNEGEHMPSHPHYRGFARSDDGGATWAEVWYANDPGRATGMIDAPSDQGIDRSEKTG